MCLDNPDPPQLPVQLPSAVVSPSGKPEQAAANTSFDAAESMAAKLLESPVSPVGLQELVPLLTSEIPPRGGASQSSVSWSSRAYAQGSLIGLRHHCTSHPLCTKLLCKCVNSVLPELEFTSVAIFPSVFDG